MIKIDSIQQLKSTINTYSDICQISEYLYVIIFMKKGENNDAKCKLLSNDGETDS